MTPPAASAAGRTLPRPVAPRAPRRVSGPAARPRRNEDARRRAAAAPDPFVLRALRRTQRLSDSRLLDRLIRGRLWIPLVAAGLMGIVFMQVSMLKLNAGIGRAVQSAGTLERQNQTLRADVSRMEAGSKIDAVAKSLGMVEPSSATGPNYVSASAKGLAAAAAKRMTPADPDAILRAKQATALANGQAASSVTTGTAAAATTGVATTAGTGVATTAAGTTGTATTAAATTPQTAATTPPPATPPAQATTPPPAATPAPTTPTAATTTGGTGATTGAVAATQQAPSSTSGGAVAPVAG